MAGRLGLGIWMGRVALAWFRIVGSVLVRSVVGLGCTGVWLRLLPAAGLWRLWFPGFGILRAR